MINRMLTNAYAEGPSSILPSWPTWVDFEITLTCQALSKTCGKTLENLETAVTWLQHALVQFCSIKSLVVSFHSSVPAIHIS